MCSVILYLFNELSDSAIVNFCWVIRSVILYLFDELSHCEILLGYSFLLLITGFFTISMGCFILVIVNIFVQWMYC